jgi:hypothetical protein
MTEKKKAAPLKQAAATQKISKEELQELLKKAEEEDPEADQNVDVKEEPKQKKK